MKRIEQAMSLIEQNQIDEALAILEAEQETADPERLFAIADLYSQIGFLQKAALIMERLLEQFPGDLELSAMLADLFIELGEDEAALELLDSVSVDDPADPQYLPLVLQQADLYQAQGLFEVAEQKLLQAKQHHPNEVILDFALGELLFSIGEYNRAAAYYEKVHAKHAVFADVQIVERLAESLAAGGHYERALEFYQEAESGEPDFLFKFGFTAYQADRKDIAIQVWNELIEADPDYVTVYDYLARAYEDEKRLDEAYDTIQAGLKKDTFNKNLFYEAGVLAYELGKQEESEQHLREAVALDPDYREAVLFLIRLLKGKEEHEQIIELISHIQENGADDAIYDWEAARAYSQTENYNEALNHYNKAYTSLKEDGDFLKEYGYFLIEEGRTAEAVPVLESYIQMEPLDTDTQAYLERITGSR